MRPTTPLRVLGRIGSTLLLTGISCAYPRAREAPGEPPQISSVELSRDYSMSEMALLVRIEEEASGPVTGSAWMGSSHLNRELLPGPRTLARRAFEAHVDSVLVDVEKAARVGP